MAGSDSKPAICTFEGGKCDELEKRSAALVHGGGADAVFPAGFPKRCATFCFLQYVNDLAVGKLRLLHVLLLPDHVQSPRGWDRTLKSRATQFWGDVATTDIFGTGASTLT